MKNNILWLLLVMLLPLDLHSQVPAEVNSDEIYVQALEAYRNSNFEEAVALTEKGLKVAPEYHDIRILMIRALWALNRFEEADVELAYLLQNAAEYPDVKPLIHQRINRLETVEEQLEYINKIEKIFPGDLELQARKADLLIRTGRRAEGRVLAADLLENPSLQGAERYALQLLLTRTSRDEVGIAYQYVAFSDDYSRNDWQNFSVEYQHNFDRTAVIGRVNYADRGYDNGRLYEIEAYPVFGKRFYAFANFGFSNGEIFPELRSSLSLYYNFWKVFEAEAGGRMLIFNGKTYFTGIAGLSFYTGNFYFNVRSFFGPERLDVLAQNYQASVRYYYKNVDNYFFARIGSGISPDEGILSTQILTNPTLEGFYLTGGINFSAGIHHLFQIGAGVLKEEISAEVSGDQFFGNVGYRYRF